MVSTPTTLEVPGEPGVYWCARHSKVKTRLRCGRCEKPICPKCTIIGPTGARCRDCASNRTAHIYQIKPWQYGVAFLIAFGLSLVASLLSTLTMLSLFAVFYAPLIGTLIAKAVAAVVRGKRGTSLAVVASAGIVLGTLTPLNSLLFGTSLLFHFSNPLLWLFLVLAIMGAWWWLK